MRVEGIELGSRKHASTRSRAWSAVHYGMRASHRPIAIKRRSLLVLRGDVGLIGC